MTADEARKLAKHGDEKIRVEVEAMDQVWEATIAEAARAGMRSVRISSSSIGRLRMPISDRAKAEALENLKRMGFKVRTVADGLNESAVEVTW